MSKTPKRTGLVQIIVPGLTLGLVAGILIVLFQASYASLLFSGDLAPFVSRGIGFMILGSTVALVISVIFARSGVALVPQDSPVAVLATMATAVTTATRATMPIDQTFLTVVALVMLTTILTGVTFLVVGKLDLARFVRFVPHPVVGGFLAGIGWLLVRGGIEMMVGYWPSPGQIGLFLQRSTLLHWGPGVALGLLLTLVTRRFRHYLVMPVVLIAAVAAFYGLLRLAGLSTAQATARGWLLGGFGEQRLWLPLRGSLVRSVHWASIVSQAASIGTVLIISTLAILLNVSGIEILSGDDLDPRRELIVAGATNLAAGLAASPPAYHSLSYSALTARVGRSGRIATAVTAVICVLVLAFGLRAMSLFPRPILGAMIVFMGLGLIVEWLYDGWFRLSVPDYVLVVLILLVVAFFGVLPGVGVGTLGAVVVFAVNYGRTDVIYHELTGADVVSNVSRSAEERLLLRSEGCRTLVLKLRGFVFFGTAYPIYQVIRRRLAEADAFPLAYVVLDMRRVRGLDGSAELAIERVLTAAEQGDTVVVIAAAHPEVRKQLARSRSLANHSRVVRFAVDLDHALEWCEDRILEAGSLVQDRQDTPQAVELLTGILGNRNDAEAHLAPLLETIRVDAGVRLIHHGETADRLFFVASGELGVYLETPEQPPIRLRTMRQGTVFGEIALYLGIPRSVDVAATRPPTVCYALSNRRLAEMERADPGLAVAFHQYLIRVLAERLVDVNRALTALAE